MKHLGPKLKTFLLGLAILMALPALFPSPSFSGAVNSSGWGWRHGGNSLHGIWGASPSDVFAVGSSGTILHYDGRAWTAMDTGATDDLYAVWGSSPSDVIAVGQSGTILRYDGSAWRRASTAGCLAFQDVWGSSPSDIYAVGPGASAHFDGTSWTTQCDSRQAYQAPVYAVWGSSAADTFMAGRNNMVSSAWLMHNSTLEWSWATPPGSSLHVCAIWGSSSNDVFAAGDLGTMVHYDGTAWVQMPMPGTANLSGVWGSSPQDVFAVGSGGAICRFDGTRWLSIVSGTTKDLAAVWGSSAANVFAVGSSGTILHYDGSAWDTISGTREGTGVDLYGVWGSSPSDVFAVGQGGAILHYDGRNWSAMASGTANDLRGVWGASASDVFAVGDRGTVLHYDGSAWRPMPSTFDAWLQDTWGSMMGEAGSNLNFGSLYGIWGSSANDLYAVGGSEVWWNGGPHQRGIILHGNGTAWETAVGNADCALYGAWGVSGRDIFVCGGCSLVGHFDGNAWGFTHLFDWTDRLFDIWGSSAADVYAVGGNRDNQHVRHYDGTAWAMADTGLVRFDPHAVWGSSASNVFVASYSTYLESWVNMVRFDGTSWQAMDSGTRNELYDVWGTSPYDVFAVGSGGTILHYRDLPPGIESVHPIEGRRGETLEVVITGANLAGATAVRFGEGVTVSSYSVDGDSQITASITLDKQASTGARDVSVTTPAGTVTAAAGFEVAGAPSSTGYHVWLLAGVGVAAALLLGAALYLAARRRRAAR